MRKACLSLNRFIAYSLFCCVLQTVSANWLAAQTPAAPTPTPAPAPAPAAATAATPAPTEATSTLTIRITGIRNTNGKIGVALFRDGKGFPSDFSSIVAAKQVEIDPQTLSAKAVFEKLPQGVYAAALLHDEKLIGRMEFDSQGIPQSGFGISNNPDTTQGPPTPEQAEFTVSQPETAIEIKMVYLQ